MKDLYLFVQRPAIIVFFLFYWCPAKHEQFKHTGRLTIVHLFKRSPPLKKKEEGELFFYSISFLLCALKKRIGRRKRRRRREKGFWVYNLPPCWVCSPCVRHAAWINPFTHTHTLCEKKSKGIRLTKKYRKKKKGELGCPGLWLAGFYYYKTNGKYTFLIIAGDINIDSLSRVGAYLLVIRWEITRLMANKSVNIQAYFACTDARKFKFLQARRILNFDLFYS